LDPVERIDVCVLPERTLAGWDDLLDLVDLGTDRTDSALRSEALERVVKMGRFVFNAGKVNAGSGTFVPSTISLSKL
jgi:hypothetical protein